jgi:hypothetical protein
MSKAQGVGDDEPLPAVDLLAGVVTTAVASDGVRALDACESMIPALGWGLRPCCTRACSRSAASINGVALPTTVAN